jgi:uncharacterized membrane protein YdbT with pleckstrin-like domain
MRLHPDEHVLYEGHPSWRSILAYYLEGLIVTVIGGVVGFIADGIGLAVGIAVLILAIVVLAGFVRRIATTYTITNQRLRIKRGIIARHIQQTAIERVQNTSTSQSLFERLLAVGTVDFDTAGSDDSDFKFAGVEDPEEVVDAVERAHKENQGGARAASI